MYTVLFLVFAVCLTHIAHSQDVSYFWMLSDFHYDPWYGQYGIGSCNINMTEYGTFGDFECDTPWQLVKSSVEAMKALDGDGEPSFILLSGDHTPHPIKQDQLDEEWIVILGQNITDAVTEVYPDTLVLPILGNHDFWPKNNLPGEPNEIYDQFADMWSAWIEDDEAQQTFRQAGYYTRPVGADELIQAVVLNDVMYFPNNDATEGEDDPGNQFTWLEETLTGLRDSDRKAFLFFHAPVGKVPRELPGSSFLREEQNARLSDIITSYSDVIIKSFTAHTHADSYMLFYSEEGDPVSAVFIGPAVTPWRRRSSPENPDENGPAHNPGLRKVVYSTETLEVTEIEQYFLQLEEANENQTAEWELAYKFTELYGIPDLSPASLQELVDKMSEDDSAEFESFVRMNLVNTDHPSVRPCNCTCKTSHLCGIQYVYYGDFDDCYDRQEACPESFWTRTTKLDN